MEETNNPIEEAKQIVNELKVAKEELRQLLNAIQNEKATEILNGKAEAGASAPPVDVEQQKTDRINALLKDTGLHI